MDTRLHWTLREILGEETIRSVEKEWPELIAKVRVEMENLILRSIDGKLKAKFVFGPNEGGWLISLFLLLLHVPRQ
jgi:hypothetical protein